MYNNDFDITTTAPQTSGLESFFNGATGALAVLVVLLVLIALAVVVLVIVANCKMFAKAGEKWWKGLIPLYSTWVETRITGLAWWWFIIFALLTAYTAKSMDNVSFVWSWGLLLTTFNYNYNLAKKFGKSNGFAFLLTILPVIGLPILAFGSSKYEKSAKVDKNGIFSIEK